MVGPVLWFALGCGSGPGREDVSVLSFGARTCEWLLQCGCLSPDFAEGCAPTDFGFDEETMPLTVAFDPECMARMDALLGQTACGDAVAVGYADLCPIYHGAGFEGQDCGPPDPFAGGEGGQDIEPVLCGRGLFCIGGRCTDPASVGFGGLGETCDLLGCDEGLLCDGGVCQLPPGVGEPCVDEVCAAGLSCRFDPVAGGDPTCVALAADGQGCMGHSECTSGNCPRGRCEPPAGEGDACGSMLPCGPGFSCVEQVCTQDAAAASGQLCESMAAGIFTALGE
jgi:hypothetical protein